MVRVAGLVLTGGAPAPQLVERCIAAMDGVSERHAPGLLVLPPLLVQTAEAEALAEGSELFSRLSSWAEQRSATLLLSLCERDDAGNVTAIRSHVLPAADRQPGPSASTAGNPWTRVETPVGRVAVLAPGAEAHCEPPRAAALHGARLLCAGLAIAERDTCEAHLRTRAAENACHLLALSPLEVGEPSAPVPPAEAAALVVGPDGQVLQRDADDAGAMLLELPEVDEASPEPEPAGRRPALYRALSRRARRGGAHASPDATDAREVLAAVWTPGETEGEDLVEAACEAIASFAAQGGQLLVLPELFCFPDGRVDEPETAAEAFVPVVRALCEACRGSGLHVVTSLVERRADDEEALSHVGLLLGAAGIVARQPQLEPSERHAWARLGKRQETWALPYGVVALLVGDDARSPELSKVAALADAELLCCPSEIDDHWLHDAGFVSRASETGCQMLVASRLRDGRGSVLVERVPASGADSPAQPPVQVRVCGEPGLCTTTLVLGGSEQRPEDFGSAQLAEPRHSAARGPARRTKVGSAAEGDGETAPR